MKFILTTLLSLATPASYAQWQPISSASTDNGDIYHLNGNIGIGTSSPASMLHLNSTVDARKTFRIYWNNDVTKYLSVFQGTGGAAIDPIGTGFLYLGYDMTTNVIMNGKLGIGTASPSSKLTIDGIDNYSDGITIQNTTGYKHLITAFADGNNPTTGSGLQFKVANNNAGGNVAIMTLKGSGNVGIGTSSPNSKLVISDGSNNAISMNSGVGVSGLGFNRNVLDGAIFNSSISAWQFSARDGMFTLEGYNGASPNLISVLKDGNVGIGTTSPNQKLTVNGTIYGKEVKVDLSVPGPDYVFEKDYQLPSLNHVQSYIDENKHLPEVPSAAEMERKGINLSEMNMLLLKKVEELTLYMIEMKKEIQKLQSERNN